MGTWLSRALRLSVIQSVHIAPLNVNRGAIQDRETFLRKFYRIFLMCMEVKTCTRTRQKLRIIIIEYPRSIDDKLGLRSFKVGSYSLQMTACPNILNLLSYVNLLTPAVILVKMGQPVAVAQREFKNVW